MRIAFDARHAGRGLGIATFVINLGQALVELGSADLIWLGDPALAPLGIEQIARSDQLPYPMLDGPLGRLFLRHLGADVVHFTGNTGWGRPGPLPTVLTLHDLIFLSTGLRGRSMRQLAGHRYERWMVRHALAAATVLAVPSLVVAQEVADRFPATQPAHVVYEGVTAPTQPRPPKRDPPYIVAFAGRDPRKGTADVVAAWRIVGTPLRLRLLAGGGLAPDLREQLLPDVESGAVEILPHLPRRALWEVLGGALALAYPTSAEGFGLPVLEAMAVGTPVLTGLAAATREIGADAIVALDAHHVPESIAAAIKRLQVDSAYAQAVVARGCARARQFSWRRTAQRYEELYREAMEHTR